MFQSDFTASGCLILSVFQLFMTPVFTQYQGASHQHAQQAVPYGQPGQPPAQPQHYGQPAQPGQNLLHDKARIQDREHIKEHLGGIIGDPDLGKMSEEELQFHYFKMHDSDNNNKLDGSELIKSLIHWHVEEHKHLGQNAPPGGTTKIFTDAELSNMIDPILQIDDRNMDGFIDYPEFVAAQKSRGF
ncbi:multiple coagulation factor deficiency protein 2 [Tetranychus urticae]|uniref:EF-hand domain-containing protein n=1 Tax=Tetranychus urticae TaxID=32264 RepID=T1KDL3_TETUR|nr:multiple coagulation factor deficiency protein 2 [Tetranychus urticae]